MDTQNIIPSLNDLLKLEYLVASTGFSLLPKQPVHSVLAGKHASKLRGRGLDFEEARKYVAGDDIRNIDWRVTARTRTTHTKVFTEEKEKPALVITDLTNCMFFGSEVYTKSYIAAQIAAISAFKVLKNGDRFSGLVFSDSGSVFFRPQRSRKAILQYLQQVVKNSEAFQNNELKVASNTPHLENALKRTSSITSHDYLILIISDFYNISPKSKQQLIQLSKHNDVILCQVQDAMEHQLPDEKLILSDGDLQLLWQQKQTTNHRFKELIETHQNQFTDEMLKYNIPIIQLNTQESIELQLKNLFKSKLKHQ
ncbi:DUF58 domain-containing protein [Carboxylicivirga sp. A043]|uniref:DUF58 domain-containing protein n=1 Tax=Carboxylicivirga litoralis TaxID=2816963 RepID=UPI0021CB376B|nr:DUF58 domain-containing protein [Carboxylicivirga sp. A043]MCU4156303.1 DUF58 domain-containing protein [Carboxylicivirga sp. A043]